MRCKASDCFTCPYPDCINPEPLKIRIYTEEEKKKSVESVRNLRKRRKELGQCPYCGVALAPDSKFKMCLECRIKSNRNRKNWRIRNGYTPQELLDGVERCKKCGKAPPKPGYKLCERCYNSNVAHAAIGTANSRKKGNPHFEAFGNAFWEERKGAAKKKGQSNGRDPDKI